MLRFDLILLPILGGYAFLATFNPTKFYHQRIEKQRLIFNCLIVAFILAAIALSLDYHILRPYASGIRSFCGSLNPIKYDGLNQAVLVFCISYPLAKISNLVFTKKKAVQRAVDNWGNDFEKLFWKSLNTKNDEGKLLMVTAKSNKVYVGYVSRISEPINNSHITIIPNFSGYREKETQNFVLTTDYLEVLEHYIKLGQEKEINGKMGIVIPLSEIVMVSQFSSEIFARFKAQETAKTTEKTNGNSSGSKLAEIRENFFKLVGSIFSSKS